MDNNLSRTRIRNRLIAFFMAFVMVVGFYSDFIMTAYASGVTEGSSFSISSRGAKDNPQGGIVDLDSVIFRVFISRDPAFYHSTQEDKERAFERFSHMYPYDHWGQGFFFVPYVYDSFQNYGVGYYDPGSRMLDVYRTEMVKNRVIKSKFRVTSKPPFPAKDLLEDYSFTGSGKKYSELAGGKWKEEIIDKITEDDAHRVWAYITNQTGEQFNVSGNMNDLISPYASESDLHQLDNEQKEDVARGFLALLMTSYKLAPYGSRGMWDMAIEDYLRMKDQTVDGSPVSIVVDTATAVRRNLYNDSIVLPSIDYLQYSASINANRDLLHNVHKLPASASGNTYDMLLEITRMTIADDQYQDISRVTDYYNQNNPFSHGLSGVIYPYKRFSTANNTPQYTDAKPHFAVMDVLQLKDFGNGKRILGFNYAAFHPVFDKPGQLLPEDISFDLDVTPKNEIIESDTIGQPVKMVITHDPSSPEGMETYNSWDRVFKHTGYQQVIVKVTWEREVDPSATNAPSYSGGHVSGFLKDTKWFREWLRGEQEILVMDNSTINEPIQPGQEKKYTYKPTITIIYDFDGEEKQVVIDAVESDYASFIRRPENVPDPILYTSVPSAYAEFKEGTPDNETFDAMSGTPSTQRLYLGVGGSEFIVDVELEYKQAVDSVWRQYRSYFSAVDSEHKAGDNAGTGSIGGHTVDLHNGGTYFKEWTGSIPNDGKPVTVKGSGDVKAVSPAVPDMSDYEAAKAEADAYVAEVNSTLLTHTASSDKETRQNSNWGASITVDNPVPPEDTEASNSCFEPRTDSEGNTYQAPLPCEVTAQPDGPGSFTIKVEFTVPAHILCGPECNYTLPAIEDRWQQRVTFDYLKILKADVYKIEEGKISRVGNLFGPGNDELKATIVQGDPEIFYNIAQQNAGGDDVAAQSSKHGRIRYSLETLKHDYVEWYEGPRTDKSDGQGWNGSSFSSAIGQGHANAQGILYTNSTYTTEKDYHKSNSNSYDQARPEFKTFDERRTSENTATIISDMLILQTSSGDQSVIYFEKKSEPKQAQEQFDPVEATKEEMWDNNPYSASNWSPKQINIGSYNGNYYATGNGEQNNRKYWGYNQVTQQFISTKAIVPTAFDDNGAGVNASRKRPSRPSKLYIQGSNQIVPTTPNGAYSNGGSEVLYVPVLNYKSPNPYTDYGGAQATPSIYTASPQPSFENKVGLVFPARYSDAHAKVNDVVIHTPVSTEKAVIIGLDPERDQRVDPPPGAATMINDRNALEICPLDPALCEFRVLNCKYFLDVTLAEFDFENVTGTTILNKITGAYIPYTSSPGISVGHQSGFGEGNVLKAFGTRWSINFADIGLTNDRDTTVLIEMDFWMPATASGSTMVVSFERYDFYIPGGAAGQGRGTWNTGNGWERRLEDVDFRDRKMRLGLEFSFASIEDNKVYIDGVEQPFYTRVNESRDLADRIGTKLNIGSFGYNDNYPAKFYVDNLKITKKGGSHTHTEACYINTTVHDMVWNHGKLTENNVHVHTADCIHEFPLTNESLPSTTVYNFEYTGEPQLFEAPVTGRYQLEVWGAEGGYGYSNGRGGKGGYSKGEIDLTKGEKLLVYVGGRGTTYTSNTVGGWNGGGNGNGSSGAWGGSGGGATDIRKPQTAGEIYNLDNKMSLRTGTTRSGDVAVMTSPGHGVYGPYIKVERGIYQVDVYGTNLHHGKPLIHADYGTTDWTGRILELFRDSVNRRVTYYVDIPSATNIVEFTWWQNISATSTFSHMTVTKLDDRLIVAGGGGGGGHNGMTGDYGGAGGGLEGQVGGAGRAAGSQNSGYHPGIGQSSFGHDMGAGGGGYYGGLASNIEDRGGSGGSGYIGGVSNGSTIRGNQTMPNPHGGNMVGRTGHGYARITILQADITDNYQGYTWEEIFGPGWENYFIEIELEEELGKSRVFKATTTGRYGSTNNRSEGDLGNNPNMINGMYRWIVPKTGVYRIEVLGAKGGDSTNWSVSGGRGARVQGDFQLTKGDELIILAGQTGGSSFGGGGGGGGSFVARYHNFNVTDPLIVAGGGGGASYTSEGGAGKVETGNGYGGTYTSGKYPGGTGGGFYSSGLSGFGKGGSALSTTAQGGEAHISAVTGWGGYGGGGGNGYFGGGGGGGYQGGSNGHTDGEAGGGGYSYNAGQNKVSQSAFNDGSGRITITEVSDKRKVTTINWSKVRADAVKGVFPEKMSDGTPNPLFGCNVYFGSYSSLGLMEGRTGNGTSIVEVTHPETGEKVTALRLNKNYNTPVIFSDFMNLYTNEKYYLEFDYWADADNVQFNVDLYPDTLPEIHPVAGKSVKHYKWEVSSSHSNMSNARLRFFNDRTKPNPANIYITNIRFYGEPEFNTHIHNENCRTIRTLDCTDPHHRGDLGVSHYDSNELKYWSVRGSGKVEWDSEKNAWKVTGHVEMYLRPEYAIPIDPSRSYTLEVTMMKENDRGKTFYWGGERRGANRELLNGYGGTYDYVNARAEKQEAGKWLTYKFTGKTGTQGNYTSWGDAKYYSVGGLINYNGVNDQVTWIKDIKFYDESGIELMPRPKPVVDLSKVQHYDGSSSICWDACGVDENHVHNKPEIETPDGDTLRMATFINIDYPFQIYFPNNGDFAQSPGLQGIPNLTTTRGKGYVDNMNTVPYTAIKRVRFMFNVVYNGDLYTRGSWISLPIDQEYYDFYAVLGNVEASAATVDFEVIPINGLPTGDPVNENYQTTANRERSNSFAALHGAYKRTYVDVVGRIGNFVVSDTEDFRFSNVFKQSIDGEWIVEGLVNEVDTRRQNKFYGDLYDIRGVLTNDTGYGLNTYGTQTWLEDTSKLLPLPINPKDNVIQSLREDFLKVGYDVFADISTIGNYQDGFLRVLPYYYKLDLDTGDVTPLDAYIEIENEFIPVSLYMGADDGTLPSNLYEHIISLNWDKESSRRNYTMEESVVTDRVASNHIEYIYGPVDIEGTPGTGVVAVKRLVTPLGSFLEIGNAQRLVVDKKARTFIGSTQTYGVEYNIGNKVELDAWEYNAQRWHMKFGLPSSTVFVQAGVTPTQERIDEIREGNAVILLTADIVALGNLYTLRWTQPGLEAFTVTQGGSSRTFSLKGSSLPPVIALYDLTQSSAIDVTVKGSH